MHKNLFYLLNIRFFLRLVKCRAFYMAGCFACIGCFAGIARVLNSHFVVCRYVHVPYTRICYWLPVVRHLYIFIPPVIIGWYVR